MCSYHECGLWFMVLPSPELFILQNWNSVPFPKTLSPHSPFTSPCQPLLSASIILTHLVPHGSGIIMYLSFCVWVTSLSIISSWFIHLVACVRIVFYFKAEQCFIVYIYCILFIQIDGHLGCSYPLAIVNSAFMNVNI